MSKLDLRSWYERQWNVQSSDERMTQSLQWSKPFSLVNLQNLLDEVNELKDLNLIFIFVLKIEIWRDEAVVLVIFGHFSLLSHVLFTLLFPKLRDKVLLEKLQEVVVLVIIHWLLYFVLHVWRHHRPNEIVECLEHVSLLL